MRKSSCFGQTHATHSKTNLPGTALTKPGNLEIANVMLNHQNLLEPHGQFVLDQVGVAPAFWIKNGLVGWWDSYPPFERRVQSFDTCVKHCHSRGPDCVGLTGNVQGFPAFDFAINKSGQAMLHNVTHWNWPHFWTHCKLPDPLSKLDLSLNHPNLLEPHGQLGLVQAGIAPAF